VILSLANVPPIKREREGNKWVEQAPLNPYSVSRRGKKRRSSMILLPWRGWKGRKEREWVGSKSCWPKGEKKEEKNAPLTRKKKIGGPEDRVLHHSVEAVKEKGGKREECHPGVVPKKL